MSETRETRRERVRRLADVPDAHIKIRWGRLFVNLIAAAGIVGWGWAGALIFWGIVDRL